MHTIATTFNNQKMHVNRDRYYDTPYKTSKTRRLAEKGKELVPNMQFNLNVTENLQEFLKCLCGKAQ